MNIESSQRRGRAAPSSVAEATSSRAAARGAPAGAEADGGAARGAPAGAEADGGAARGAPAGAQADGAAQPRRAPPPSPARAPRELLADRAYVALRDRIITLRIAPGAPIDEDRLGEELAMGRTPVREAVKRLALENLVTVFPRRGTFASEINITDLTHISDVRTVLEGHAAYRAAQRITEAQRAELAELVDELSRSQGSDDGEALMALDARVHRFIYGCAGNPYLEETLGRYFNLSLRIWHLVIDHLPHLFARVHEHDDVLHAIASGEAERARDVLIEHIATFEREIRSVL
jgi:DNA-binding GntR family transcriptional regulator